MRMFFVKSVKSLAQKVLRVSKTIYYYLNYSQIVRSGVHLSYCVQRIWILLANICHGLLAGLGLAHLLLVFTTKPMDWIEGVMEHYSDFATIYASTFYCFSIICMVSVLDRYV